MGYLHSKLGLIKKNEEAASFIINNIIYFLLKCDQVQLLFL